MLLNNSICKLYETINNVKIGIHYIYFIYKTKINSLTIWYEIKVELITYISRL